MENRIIVSFFLLGLSLGLGPCLVSCGPLLISYIAGTQKNIAKSIWAYLLFSLSRASIYVILGLSVFLFGQLVSKYIFSAFSRYIFIFGGIFMLIVGLLITFGRNLHYKFCQGMQGFFLKKDAKTIFIFGLIIGMLPCFPLMSLLSYIGLVSKTWPDSVRYSLSFGLGTIISPLFILAAFTGLIPRIFMHHNKFYGIFNSFCGLVISFLGFQLIMKAF